MSILNIPQKYLEFFVRNHEVNRYVLLQGGRRSGKTFSTLMWLYFLCSGTERFNIMIAAASSSQLQATIQDAEDCLGLVITGNKVYGDSCILPNGSLWQFKNFDEYTKCVGQKADYLFLNEAVNLDEKSFGTLIQGIRKQIILNYNPTRACWVDKYINQEKDNLMITTWQDNPYLTEYQIEEFENIKRRALSPTATIFDKYAYEVFYKGVFTNMSGKCFQQVYSCTDEEFEKIPSPVATGMDFGFVDSKDFTTLVQVKIYQNCLYARERIYSNHLTNNKDLAMELAKLGYDCFTQIACDYGGLGKKQRIDILSTANNGEWTEKELYRGFGCISAHKPAIIENIREILQYDKIILTESSINLRKEMDGYELTGDGKPKGTDHAIDAMRYAQQYFKKNF